VIVLSKKQPAAKGGGGGGVYRYSCVAERLGKACFLLIFASLGFLFQFLPIVSARYFRPGIFVHLLIPHFYTRCGMMSIFPPDSVLSMWNRSGLPRQNQSLSPLQQQQAVGSARDVIAPPPLPAYSANLSAHRTIGPRAKLQPACQYSRSSIALHHAPFAPTLGHRLLDVLK
jgi:hypothetical protein